jgi:hypothetical protein
MQRNLVDVVLNNIDMRESTILNCSHFSSDVLRSFLSPTPTSIESDADHQLIVKLKFNDKIDCSQLFVYPPNVEAGDEDREVSGAKIVKVFVNQNNLDFSDIENMTPVAQFELPFEYEDGKPFAVPLSGAKFTRVPSLQLFVEENYGTEFSRLGGIKIEGFIAPSYHTK